MCCISFLVKYVLFISNLIFTILGVAVLGLGIAVLVGIKDFEAIFPIKIIPISLIVLGSVVFCIGFLACCGAIRESRCMLIFYSIVVGILAAFFIYLSVLIFSQLGTIEEQVDKWIVTAFNKDDVRPVFNVLEVAFQCCGTTGPDSYLALNQTLPPTCCPNPGAEVNTCTAAAAFKGCGSMVGGWFASFSKAIGGVLLVVIVVQVVSLVFAVFLTCSITVKRRRNAY